MQFSAHCSVQFTAVYSKQRCVLQYNDYHSELNCKRTPVKITCTSVLLSSRINWNTQLADMPHSAEYCSVDYCISREYSYPSCSSQGVSLHLPIKLFFRCLATTDHYAGLVSEPLFVINLISVDNESWIICRYTSLLSFLVGSILASVSLLTVTTISVDRLLALLLGLRCRYVVSLRRTYVAVTVLWILAIVATAMYFWNEYVSLWFAYTSVPVCPVISVFSYTKIFLALRHNRSQVEDHGHRNQEQHSQTGALNIGRYRKAVSSALWVQSSLVLCCLPYSVAGILMTKSELSSTLYVVRELTLTLVFLNLSLNPILCCWKIREVRQAVKDTIERLRCSATQVTSRYVSDGLVYHS